MQDTERDDSFGLQALIGSCMQGNTGASATYRWAEPAFTLNGPMSDDTQRPPIPRGFVLVPRL